MPLWTAERFYMHVFWRQGWMLPIVCWDMSSNSSTQTHLEIQSGIQRDLSLFGLNWSFHFAQSPHPCILIWMSEQIFHLLDRVWTLFDTPDRLKGFVEAWQLKAGISINLDISYAVWHRNGCCNGNCLYNCVRVCNLCRSDRSLLDND